MLGEKSLTEMGRRPSKSYFLLVSLALLLAACTMPVVQRHAVTTSVVSTIPPYFFDQCLFKHGLSQTDLSSSKYQGEFYEEFELENKACPLTNFSVVAQERQNEILFRTCAEMAGDLASARSSEFLRTHSQDVEPFRKDTLIASGWFHPFKIVARYKEYKIFGIELNVSEAKPSKEISGPDSKKGRETSHCAVSNVPPESMVSAMEMKPDGSKPSLVWYPLGIYFGLGEAWYPNTFGDVSQDLSALQGNALEIDINYRSFVRPARSKNMFGLGFELGGDFPGDGTLRGHLSPIVAARRYFSFGSRRHWFLELASGWEFLRGGPLDNNSPTVTRRGPLMQVGLGLLGEQPPGDPKFDGYNGSSTNLAFGVRFLNYGPGFFIGLSWGVLQGGGG